MKYLTYAFVPKASVNVALVLQECLGQWQAENGGRLVQVDTKSDDVWIAIFEIKEPAPVKTPSSYSVMQSVYCPFCHADAGEPCMDQTGTQLSTVHQSRVALIVKGGNI